MQIIEYFDRGAKRWPDRNCLVDSTYQVTYRQASANSHRIANALRRHGARIETPIAVYSQNSAVAFEAVLGIVRSGATWLPVNARAAQEELQTFLKRHRCRILFFSSELAGPAREIANNVPSIDLMICLDGTNGDTPEMHEWCAMESEIFPIPPLSDDNIVIIKSTGGTTGVSKSVMQTHGNHTALIETFKVCMPFDKPPVHLVAAPMTHGAGAICFPLFASGATHVFMKKADPGAILKAIAEDRVNVIFLPPTVIYMMLAHADLKRYDYSSLKYFIYAAAPMSADKLRAAMETFGPVMAQTYGQAEAPMLCTFLAPSDHVTDDPVKATRLVSCGRATPLTQVAIMDDDGNLLPDGERGEIVVRGGLVFKGYFEDPGSTREVSLHGWHHTGDVGYRDQDGYIFIVDRKKDMIISGGFNIYPSEIEQVLWSHESVQDCAVIGVPDEKWGEAVKAVIELKPGCTVDSEVLMEMCRKKLGGVKTPKSVDFWPELPRSAVGKVLKKDVRRVFWAGRDRAI